MCKTEWEICFAVERTVTEEAETINDIAIIAEQLREKNERVVSYRIVR